MSTRPGRHVWCAALVFVAAVLGSGGCVSAMLAPKIVTAPNSAGAPPLFAIDRPEARVALAQLYARTLRVSVPGPPAAEIALSVVEPGDYHLEHSLAVEPAADGKPAYVVNSHWEPLSPGAPAIPAAGTIVLLHGFWMSREAVLHWGVRLAQAGFRTVAVDLRGHGSSTGPWVTYGAVEVSDLAAVLDRLQADGLAGSRIGVLGVSYGAAIGIQWAARDSRVGALVALEPYADPQLAIRQYARAMLSPTANRALSDRTIRAATGRAARLAGFAWSDVDVKSATSRLRVPVLLIHGGNDALIPVEHSRALSRLAPAGSRLIEVPGANHFSLSMQLEGCADEVEAWFRTDLVRE